MRVIIVTGRTEEPLTKDGVVITNGFTGRQGQEIARAFVRRGADVTVIAGPPVLPEIEGARTVRVRTLREMQDAALREIETPADIYVSVASIADFSAPAPLDLRLKPDEPLKLQIIENPSLLAAVTRHKSRPKIVVGFAAQTADVLLDYAMAKFRTSGVNLTVANPIGPGSALMGDSARNEIWFITKGGPEKIGGMTKAEAAEKIVEKVLSLTGRP
jgi:phosphopantothenoylcysteine decarboxylase/phosphopantothenate--cysteine ligase